MADWKQYKSVTAAKRQKMYREHPEKFFSEVLDVKPEYIWPKMQEVIDAVKNNIKVAVSAGHGLSKTYTAGRLALWFLYCFPPATVITTAPTHKQVQELLWREIRQAHASAKVPLGGKCTRTRLDLQDETGLRWYAIGFATKPDTVTLEATAFQGYHNDHVMIIFDEAAGIMPQIYKAAEHLMTAGYCRWLAIGNPTAADGSFAEAVGGKDDWYPVNIAVLDTPNYKEDREIIPGVSGRAYEKAIREKWGKDSNEYKIRILGQLPSYSAGTFFGREMAKAVRLGHVGHYPADPAAQVYTFWDIGHTHTAIWFAQFVQQQIRVVDFYYDDEGLGLPAYAKVLQDKPYKYGQHFAPHDVDGSNAKSVQTGRYLKDVAAELDIAFTVLTDYGFDDGIAAAKDLVGLCLFHEPACREGIMALTQYRQRLDATRSTDDKPVYFKQPVADWNCHPSDAFRYMAMAYRYDLIIGEERIGYPGPLANERQLSYADSDEVYDPLGGLVRRR